MSKLIKIKKLSSEKLSAHTDVKSAQPTNAQQMLIKKYQSKSE